MVLVLPINPSKNNKVWAIYCERLKYGLKVHTHHMFMSNFIHIPVLTLFIFFIFLSIVPHKFSINHLSLECPTCKIPYKYLKHLSHPRYGIEEGGHRRN